MRANAPIGFSGNQTLCTQTFGRDTAAMTHHVRPEVPNVIDKPLQLICSQITPRTGAIIPIVIVVAHPTPTDTCAPQPQTDMLCSSVSSMLQSLFKSIVVYTVHLV